MLSIRREGIKDSRRQGGLRTSIKVADRAAAKPPPDWVGVEHAANFTAPLQFSALLSAGAYFRR